MQDIVIVYVVPHAYLYIVLVPKFLSTYTKINMLRGQEIYSYYLVVGQFIVLAAQWRVWVREHGHTNSGKVCRRSVPLYF